jgi:hypothetical protein
MTKFILPVGLRNKINNLLEHINPKNYDGNDMGSACNHYQMSCTEWKEIIRYEQGYREAISNVLKLINNDKK